MSKLHHASCVTFENVGVLLRGPAGAGKSDLALRLIEAGAALIADDQVLLVASGGRLVARPPRALAGLLEVRGLGIISLPFEAEASVGLVVDLAPPEDMPRLPEARETTIDGVVIPALKLAPFEPSAIAKLRLAAKLANGWLRLVETACRPEPTQRLA